MLLQPRLPKSRRLCECKITPLFLQTSYKQVKQLLQLWYGLSRQKLGIKTDMQVFGNTRWKYSTSYCCNTVHTPQCKLETLTRARTVQFSNIFLFDVDLQTI